MKAAPRPRGRSARSSPGGAQSRARSAARSSQRAVTQLSCLARSRSARSWRRFRGRRRSEPTSTLGLAAFQSRHRLWPVFKWPHLAALGGRRGMEAAFNRRADFFDYIRGHVRSERVRETRSIRAMGYRFRWRRNDDGCYARSTAPSRTRRHDLRRSLPTA